MSTDVNDDATAIDTVTKGIDQVDISSNNDNTSEEVIQETCASCGKEGNSGGMNMCNKCKSVKYCNAACKKKHRKKHKKACEKRVAELHEEALFKEADPEECPICFLPIPIETNESTFETCCGKKICNGCVYAMLTNEGKDICAFCRTPPQSSDASEHISRLNKLIDNGNANACTTLGGCYLNGTMGMPQNYQKANELYLKGGELGCAQGYFNLARSYGNGMGVEFDRTKTKQYLELAAMNGHVQARHHLGVLEYEAGNYHRALRHVTLAARAGNTESLDGIKQGFMDGVITKDEYASTLSAHHERQKEMKSDMRVKAADMLDDVYASILRAQLER